MKTCTVRAALPLLLGASFGSANAQTSECRLLCAPTLKLEPSVSVSNLFGGAAVATMDADSAVHVEREERDAEFEIILALGVPTTIPRVGFTLEASFKPFARTDANPFTGATARELGTEDVRANVVELELELNLFLIEPEQSGGWVEMHFDVVDQLSPAARPGDTSAYTHKLNLELDTAFRPFQRLPEGSWMRNVEVELSLDYLATGIPRAGDEFSGGVRYLENASPWSLSVVLVLPIAPLFP